MSITIQDVEGALPQAPTCNFTVSPLGPSFTYSVNGVSYSSPYQFMVYTATNLTFTGSVNLATGVTIMEYYWDFGDGTQAYGNPVSHKYVFPSPETRVSFCVTDNYRRQVCIGRVINLRAHP